MSKNQKGFTKKLLKIVSQVDDCCGSLNGFEWNEQFDDGLFDENQVDGSNRTFTATNILPPSGVEVYKNGNLLKEQFDYIISEKTITFITAPLKKDIINVLYNHGSKQPVPTRFNKSESTNVVFYGNSLFYGRVHNVSDTVAQMKNYLPTVGYNLVNRGNIFGWQTPTLITNIPTELVPYLDDSYKNNVIVINEGTNHINHGADIPTAYNALRDLCLAVKALNPDYKVIIVTILPCRPEISASVITGVNDLLIANWQTFADGIADTTTNTLIGIDSTNTTYYLPYPDAVHLWPIGYYTYAGIIYPSIMDVLGIGPQNVTNVLPILTPLTILDFYKVGDADPVGTIKSSNDYIYLRTLNGYKRVAVSAF